MFSLLISLSDPHPLTNCPFFTYLLSDETLLISTIQCFTTYIRWQDSISQQRALRFLTRIISCCTGKQSVYTVLCHLLEIVIKAAATLDIKILQIIELDLITVAKTIYTTVVKDEQYMQNPNTHQHKTPRHIFLNIPGVAVSDVETLEKSLISANSDKKQRHIMKYFFQSFIIGRASIDSSGKVQYADIQNLSTKLVVNKPKIIQEEEVQSKF